MGLLVIEHKNKEKESTFNLRRIDFGARGYNTSIGRFISMDVVDIGSKAYFGNITAEHALPTLAITEISLVTGGLGGIAIAVVYAIYEDDFWHDYYKKCNQFCKEKRMKHLIFRYLNGLNQFYRRKDDAEIYVIIILILIEGVFIICLSSIFNFPIPTSDELGNKWVVRLVSGLILWSINKYLFGIRESVYSEYPPLSKRLTLLITLAYFAVTLGYLFYASKHR